MSRIGKNPVEVPDGVSVQFSGRTVTVKGKLGEQSVEFGDHVDATQEGNVIWVKPRNTSQRARKMWGTVRSLVSNAVTGVSAGFTRDLEITGVGYRAQVQGSDLVLQLGFSHEVRHPIPEGITIQCPEPTKISISGIDKQRVGQVASEVRGYRPPEPYKGKGVRYAGEYIVRKEGKKK